MEIFSCWCIQLRQLNNEFFPKIQLGTPTNNTKRVYTTSIYVNGSESDNHENADKVNELSNTLNENRLSYYENQDRGYSTLDTAVMERNKIRLGEAGKIYHSDDEAPTARIHWMSSV